MASLAVNAAQSDIQLYANDAAKEAIQSTNNINFSHYSHCEYLSSMPRCHMYSYAGYVFGTTATGAVIGAVVGSGAGGIGAGPGAGIGAAIGFGVGVTTATAASFAIGFIKWKSTQKKEVISSIYEKFKAYAKAQSENLECPITSNSPPHDPVKTPHSNHIYERTALEEWIAKHGTCPMTRLPLKKEQLRSSVCAMAHIQRICNEIITTQTSAMKLTEEETKGLIALRADFVKNLREFFKEENENLSAQVKEGKMSYQNFASQMQQFANAAEPKVIQDDKAP